MCIYPKLGGVGDLLIGLRLRDLLLDLLRAFLRGGDFERFLFGGVGDLLKRVKIISAFFP